ncbi:Uncharacterised protein [Klebsiella pneumoniae]|uniref:Uncharacterized protein n=1 Tax=Klebsiella pneumoniae TaxID=573 RepID=A0A378H429_KLEPN|nr:Uncharacterised protein [Klebsiella pneumoniae]
MYTSDTNSMAASRALLDFCDNHPGLASFVNPVGQLPNPVNPDGNDNHLFANSYRWFGCDVGRVTDLVHRGVSRPVFRMRGGCLQGQCRHRECFSACSTVQICTRLRRLCRHDAC